MTTWRSLGPVPRFRFVPFALVAVAAAACGGGHPAPGGRGAALPAAATTYPPAAATTATTGAVPGASLVPAPGGGSGAAPGSVTTLPHEAAPTVAPAVSPAGTPVGAAVPKPAAAGTYQERQSGSFTVAGSTRPVSGQGTLVVQAATPDGTQLWQRYVQQGQPPNDTTMRFGSNGPVLVSSTEPSPQGEITCTFDPSIPAPAWPPAVGDSFSSTGNCGRFTISVSGSITGQRQASVGGTSYSVWVIDSNLVLHGQVSGTGSQEDWYSPVLRLPVHEHDQLNGNYGPFTFSSSLTSDLVSGKPA